MSSSVDLSGTAQLPVTSEILAGAASLVKYSSRAGESIGRAHDHWSRLSMAYAAPEQDQVHYAMDGPRDAGQTVLDAAFRAAEALETFAAAVADIRRRRLELQGAVEDLQEKDSQGAMPGVIVTGTGPAMAFAQTLLQARADQLTRELAAAEDQCISALGRLAGRSTGTGARALP